MSQPPLSIGLIGAGGSAYHHLVGFVHSGLVRRAVLVEPDEQARAQLCRRFGLIKADFVAPELLLADPEVPIIDVCAPLAVRAALAKLALSAGKHVILDAPPARTVAEFDELTQLATERDLQLHCPLPYLHMPAHVKLDQIRSREKLSAPLLATALQAVATSLHPEDDLLTGAYHVLYALQHFLGPAEVVIGADMQAAALSAMLVLGDHVATQLAVMRMGAAERAWGERRMIGESGYVWLRDNPEDEMPLIIAEGEDVLPVKVKAPPDVYEYAAVHAIQGVLMGLTGSDVRPGSDVRAASSRETLTPELQQARAALATLQWLTEAAAGGCAVPR